jgi:hypothetical protein
VKSGTREHGVILGNPAPDVNEALAPWGWSTRVKATNLPYEHSSGVQHLLPGRCSRRNQRPIVAGLFLPVVKQRGSV